MIDIKICEECFNYDCPTPCPATDSQKISCIKRDMIYRLKDEFDFDFENPKSYKKLASRKVSKSELFTKNTLICSIWTLASHYIHMMAN